MAFAISATAVDSNEVTIAISAAAAAVDIYRSESSYTSDIAAAFAANNLGTALVTDTTATSFTDFTAVKNKEYYYYAFDGTNWVYDSVETPEQGEFSSAFVPKSLINTNQASVFVTNQNTYGAVAFEVPVEAGNLAIVALKTPTAITDSALATLFTGTDMKFQILAKDDVTAVAAFDPKLTGRFHLRYTPQS